MRFHIRRKAATFWPPSQKHIIILRLQCATMTLAFRMKRKKKFFYGFIAVTSPWTDKNYFGLGLRIAKKILELHSGSILAGDSNEDEEKFTVTLPVQKK